MQLVKMMQYRAQSHLKEKLHCISGTHHYLTTASFLFPSYFVRNSAHCNSDALFIVETFFKEQFLRMMDLVVLSPSTAPDRIVFIHYSGQNLINIYFECFFPFFFLESNTIDYDLRCHYLVENL